MKLDLPRFTERFGSIRIHGIQRVYELDSGYDGASHKSEIIQTVDNKTIAQIESKMAIVIPIRGERLKLLEGVLSGIPHNCLIIIVSNSPRQPVDRFKLEKEVLEQFNTFTEKKSLIIHQKDKALGTALKDVGYSELLDEDDTVRGGKAEGMIIGMLLAKLSGKEYVGFIDADNYVPGAVNEYVKIFASGIAMSSTPYSMVRISWIYKPKVSDSVVHFSKLGRVSEITNYFLNSLISYYTGFETEVIRTANSGEHCMSMKLAELLTYSSGFSVEPYEIVNLLELFGGIMPMPSDYEEAIEKGIEVMQIETRNPHFHEEKGGEHIDEMLLAVMGCIFHGTMCDPKTRDRIKSELLKREILKNEDEPPLQQKIQSFKNIDIAQFGKLLEKSGSFSRLE